MIQRRPRTILIATVMIVMLACVPTLPSLEPASAPLPTFDPNSALTAIVQTARAAATQTALMAPPTFTATVTPTRTPTETPTSTPTFLFLPPPTNTVRPTMISIGSSGLEFECQIISQDPPNDSLIAKSATFEARWSVANVGKGTWDGNNTDYRYDSGRKMHLQSIYDLPATITPGVIIDLKVSMKAPSEPGIYTTVWKINMGNKSFCPMNLTINVQ